jgi:hypothetical protein
VTEDPHAHLLPHPSAAASRPESPWTLLSAEATPDGVYEIVARHAGTDEIHAVRVAIAWLSAVAESAFFVRRSEPRTVDCVTGMLNGDHEFASHGHTMRLRIAPPTRRQRNRRRAWGWGIKQVLLPPDHLGLISLDGTVRPPQALPGLAGNHRTPPV